MAKLLYVLSRHAECPAQSLRSKVTSAVAGLVPRGLDTTIRSYGSDDGKLAYAVTDATEGVHFVHSSVLLGVLYDRNCSSWWQVGEAPPSGNFGIFRDNSSVFEIVADCVASRTIWYYADERHFIASTSQQAIIAFKGEFEFNERIIPWYLSTGGLGPFNSWDKSIRQLAPGEAISVCRSSLRTQRWQALQLDKLSGLANASLADQKTALESSLVETFSKLQLPDSDKYTVPLSGGYDSRALLQYVLKYAKSHGPVNTLTWGDVESETLRGNDADIARKVSHALGTNHQFCGIDKATFPIPQAVENFLLAGEGRVDHIGGYLDGMAMWKAIRSQGIHLILRGDECFGWNDVKSEAETRLSLGIGLCSDFGNLRDFTEKHGIAPQAIPDQLQRNYDESLPDWRDRLYLYYRLPTIIAALSDLKYAYLEQYTPFLSPTVLSTSASLPPDSRTDKRLFREIACELGPSVSYATRSATKSPGAILRDSEVVELVRCNLLGCGGVGMFGSRMVSDAVAQMVEAKTLGRLEYKVHSMVRNLVSSSMRRRFRVAVMAPKVSFNLIAFRMFLILEMNRRFRSVASAAI